MDRFIKAGFKTCFIVRGLPGSGKTYLAHSIRKELDTLGYSTEMAAADDYLVNEKGEYAFDPENLGSAHMACSKKLVSAMKQGVDAVIQHNTNVKDWESQVAYDHGYLVYFVEPTYAWAETANIPPQFQWKSSHNVPEADINRMRKTKQDISVQYLGYFLPTARLVNEIQNSGYMNEYNTLVQSATIPAQLHLTTDHVQKLKPSVLLSKLQTEIMQSTDLYIHAIFKNEKGIGALVTGMNGGPIPRYKLLTDPESDTRSPHLTLCTFGKTEAVQIGFEAERFRKLLASQRNTNIGLVKLEDFSAIVFKAPLRIPAVYSGFYSTSHDNAHKHLSWEFKDKVQETIFFKLMGMKVSLKERAIKAEMSPDSRAGWVLADMSTTQGGPMEDAMFDGNAYMRAHLTRGLCYLISPEGVAEKVLAGLCKFTGMEDQDEDAATKTSTNQKHKGRGPPSVNSSMTKLNVESTESKYFLKPVKECKDLKILVTEKANGEAGHVRLMLNDKGEVLVLAGSKNVHMLFRYAHPEDLDAYSEDRYAYAKQISETFINQYPFNKPETKKFMGYMLENKYTACYEYEDPAHQHIIPLLVRQLKFITFSSDNNTKSLCSISPLEALAFVGSLGFTCVHSYVIPYTQVDKVKTIILFDKLPAEGAVLYYMDGDQVVCLQKCKNAAYILSRAVREKTVPFMLTLMKSLSVFNVANIKLKAKQVMLVKDVTKKGPTLDALVNSMWADYERTVQGLTAAQKKKLSSRLESFLATKYVPLSKASLTSWQGTGGQLIQDTSDRFLEDVKQVVMTWKSDCLQRSNIDGDILWKRIEKATVVYDHQAARDQWPARWGNHSAKFSLLTEGN